MIAAEDETLLIAVQLETLGGFAFRQVIVGEFVQTDGAHGGNCIAIVDETGHALHVVFIIACLVFLRVAVPVQELAEFFQSGGSFYFHKGVDVGLQCLQGEGYFGQFDAIGAYVFAEVFQVEADHFQVVRFRGVAGDGAFVAFEFGFPGQGDGVCAVAVAGFSGQPFYGLSDAAGSVCIDDREGALLYGELVFLVLQVLLIEHIYTRFELFGRSP